MTDHQQKRGLLGFLKSFSSESPENVNQRFKHSDQKSNLNTNVNSLSSKDISHKNPDPKKKPFNNNYYAYSSLYK